MPCHACPVLVTSLPSNQPMLRSLKVSMATWRPFAAWNSAAARPGERMLQAPQMAFMSCCWSTGNRQVLAAGDPLPPAKPCAKQLCSRRQSEYTMRSSTWLLKGMTPCPACMVLSAGLSGPTRQLPVLVTNVQYWYEVCRRCATAHSTDACAERWACGRARTFRKSTCSACWASYPQQMQAYMRLLSQPHHPQCLSHTRRPTSKLWPLQPYPITQSPT